MNCNCQIVNIKLCLRIWNGKAFVSVFVPGAVFLVVCVHAVSLEFGMHFLCVFTL